MRRICLIFSFILVLLTACKTETPRAPYQYEMNPAFKWGYAEFYGRYFSNYNINNNVLTLNLFTEKLFVNSDNALDGTGQYLILEDVFIAPSDTLIPAGTYSLSETGEPFTFFGGKKFEGNGQEIPSGAYIYYKETEPAKSKIAYVTGGTFNISMSNDSVYNIQCDFELDGKTQLKGTFKNVLYHIDRSATTSAEVTRQKLKLAYRPM
ncbi:MAG: hypothetical protein ACYC2P_07835 [Paludibacteraceae bacterium]